MKPATLEVNKKWFDHFPIKAAISKFFQGSMSQSLIQIYHSLYSILDFDWLIHLQITACKYRSAAHNWCKYFIEHAHFENASSTSIKNIVLSKYQHGWFCRVIRKRIDHHTRRKGAENTKKATKVTLNIFRGYLQEKGLREAELLT